MSTIEVGAASHGIVISQDGKNAYITNSVGNSVSIIDLSTNTVTKTIAVGESPNGISFRYPSGGMP